MLNRIWRTLLLYKVLICWAIRKKFDDSRALQFRLTDKDLSLPPQFSLDSFYLKLQICISRLLVGHPVYSWNFKVAFKQKPHVQFIRTIFLTRSRNRFHHKHVKGSPRLCICTRSSVSSCQHNHTSYHYQLGINY